MVTITKDDLSSVSLTAPPLYFDNAMTELICNKEAIKNVDYGPIKIDKYNGGRFDPDLKGTDPEVCACALTYDSNSILHDVSVSSSRFCLSVDAKQGS